VQLFFSLRVFFLVLFTILPDFITALLP